MSSTIQRNTSGVHKGFNVSKAILHSHLSDDIVLLKHIQSMPGYTKGDEENVKTCKIIADE